MPIATASAVSSPAAAARGAGQPASANVPNSTTTGAAAASVDNNSEPVGLYVCVQITRRPRYKRVVSIRSTSAFFRLVWWPRRPCKPSVNITLPKKHCLQLRRRHGCEASSGLLFNWQPVGGCKQWHATASCKNQLPPTAAAACGVTNRGRAVWPSIFVGSLNTLPFLSQKYRCDSEGF